ncbi:alginate O-acetyltransferase AlgX-related protein [Clostridium cylindrosporum]|uniref:AlgX/AlgJ SGNH hydrolase-like domain-containing protein n=1 Tax=Clostridium cylindrosporum DSM 605 TaxID=1121307 RepID=A0A0J8DFB9_CLOCY|nr:hypothetical protein [Clostridium cylindrosporum]KMT22878.1 hypothetical protein CLCY_5c01170 [Clostridium cylindrosporum DSM 605]
MNRKKSIWMTIPFLAIVFSFSAFNFISADKSESKAENRALAQKPIYGKVGIKAYTGDYEKYYTDQFALRDEFLKLHMKGEILLGKTNIKGYYLVDDGWIFQGNSLNLTESKAKEYSDTINDYGKLLRDNGKEVYYVATPQKENILISLLPKFNNSKTLLRNSSRFMSGLNRDDINVINLHDSFNERFTQDKLKDFYFKTDNHWNSKGAFEGFKIIMDAMSKSSKLKVHIKDESYKTETLKKKEFLGVYNRNLYEVYPLNESVPYVYSKAKKPHKYYLHNGEKFQEVDSSKIIATGVKDDVISYPTAYTSSSVHYKVVNEAAPVDKKLLIYRDSYHSAMSWMFEDIFREVEVVDPRYIDSSGTSNRKVAESTDADIVLFMFNDLGFVNMIDELKN